MKCLKILCIFITLRSCIVCLCLKVVVTKVSPKVSTNQVSELFLFLRILTGVFYSTSAVWMEICV